jgi:PAS domain S-box-containing protein
LFEKNNATILLIDGENLNIVDANPAACKYYGWSREELIQKKITDINLFSLDEMLKEKENARSEGRNHLHFKHRLANGKIRDVKVYNGLLNIEGKEIFYSIVIDITKKKKIENKLKESEELYRAIYTASPDLICVSDLKGKILAISHVFTSMFGYKDETQAIGQYLINFIIETERFSAKRAFLKRLNGRHARSVQYHGLRSDSSIFDIEVNADFIQDKKGEPMKIVYVIRDVTERNRIQKDLLYSRERNEALLKANPNLMFMLNMEGRFIDFHPGNNQTLYISEREFLGKRIEEVMPIEIASLGNSYLKLLFQTGKNQVFDYPLQIGSEIKYFQGQLLKNGDSEALLVVSDITPRMILQKELIKAKETAEESDRLKSAFLANMSHEIRTPMNGILGFAELLKDSEITEEEKLEYLDIIDQSGHRLLNIINDIVEISKIEAGMIVPKITECNVNQHLEYVEKFFNPEAEKKGIHLMIKNGLSSTDAVLRTDSEKLYAILINLVKNAIKYSDKGTIEIGCTKDNAEFRFYVKDEGIGIPEDKQDAIFNRFVRVSSSQKRIIEGTGLGLAITKAYLDMLGGKMWVRSNPGEGSIFYFTLPRVNEIAEIKMEKDNNLENETFGKNINVLIAEDDEFTVKLLTRYLNPFSSRIYYATNGREAVEMYNSNPNIQLILMDVQMPEMDGYEATREIRKKDQDVIIIAQTAFALSDDKLSAFDAGCTDYISKPVSQETIRRIISKYF